MMPQSGSGFSARIARRHCAGARVCARHCEGAQMRAAWRGGEAAEAIQARRAKRDGREACRVALPDSGLLRPRFARARNDGRQLAFALAMTVTSRSPLG